MIHLGYINYLNSQPFYIGLEENNLHYKLFKGNPREIIKLFEQAKIDFGQMSVYEFLQKQDEYYYLNDFCISSAQIPSVLLMTQAKTIAQLDKSEIQLTDHSITSVQLLKVLLNQKYQIYPNWLTANIEQIEENKNYLLIGDKALKVWQQYLNGHFENWQFYDLAKLWFEWTNLPFVFALFVGRKGQSLSPDILKILQNNLQNNLNSLSTIIKANSGAVYGEPLLKEYFSLLDYKLDDRKISSLEKFAKLVDLKLNTV